MIVNATSGQALLALQKCSPAPGAKATRRRHVACPWTNKLLQRQLEGQFTACKIPTTAEMQWISSNAKISARMTSFSEMNMDRLCGWRREALAWTAKGNVTQETGKGLV
jgi:hypothetical protein